MMPERTPEDNVRPFPHDRDAERSVLAAIVVDPGVWSSLDDTFDPQAFYFVAHQHVAAELGRRMRQGEPAGPIDLFEALSAAGHNGAAKIALDLAGHHVVTSTAAGHWAIVRRHAESRTKPQATSASFPVIVATDVVETPVEWLVPGLLARGELTDLSGDPGVGKGGIVASWVTRILQEQPEKRVLILQTEDRLSLVRARLRAEGADLSRALLLDLSQPNAAPVLPRDADELEHLVVEKQVAFVALDPALEFMDSALDSHKQQDVQRFCAAIAGIAQRTGCAMLTVRHLNKAQNTAAIYRAAGSITFIGRARMALFASKDKESGKRVLAVTKGNIAKDSTAVEFDIVEQDGATVVAWGEATTVTADELANQDPKRRRGPRPEKTEAARDFLSDVLSKGAMKIDDVLRCGKSVGLSRTRIYEAKAALGVLPVTVDLKAGWRLP